MTVSVKFRRIMHGNSPFSTLPAVTTVVFWVYFSHVILGTRHFKPPSDCPRRDNRQHVGEKRPRIKEDEGSRDVKMDSFKIKLVPKEEEQEVDIQIKEEEKQHYVARDIKPLAGTIKSQIHYSQWIIYKK